MNSDFIEKRTQERVGFGTGILILMFTRRQKIDAASEKLTEIG